MNFGEMILSKIVENGDATILKKYGLQESHFPTQAEREAFRFLSDYIEKNNQAPDYRTLAASVSGDFTFMPKVSDSYQHLASELKKYSAKIRIAKLIQNDLQDNFNDKDALDFLDWFEKESDKIKKDAVTKNGIAKDLSELKLDIKKEYIARKEGKTRKQWETPFPSLTEKELLTAGDIYGIMGESGRGKSYISIAFIHSLLKQGSNVLVKSFELNAYLWVSRLFSILTAEEGAFTDESGRKVGLQNKQILQGSLQGNAEQYFFHMLDKIDAYYPGKLYLQAKGDKDLTRSLKELDQELTLIPEIDAVFLDPFYGVSDVYGKNSNKTAGGAAEQAANRFEELCGIHSVIGFYTVQATVEKKKTDDNGARELKLPTRDQVKTSKRLLDIATILFTWDSLEGIAKLGIEKGRNGNEGYELELMALLDVGVLREPPKGEELNNQFDMSIY